MKSPPRWLEELGPVVDHPDWQRPTPTVIHGQYCRLEPLDLARHGDDLWDQMFIQDPEHRQWMFLAGQGPFAGKQDFIDGWSRFDKAVDNLTYAVVPTDPALDLPPVATGQFSFLRIRPEAGSIEVGFVRFPPQMARTRPSTEAQFLLMRLHKGCRLLLRLSSGGGGLYRPQHSLQFRRLRRRGLLCRRSSRCRCR